VNVVVAATYSNTQYASLSFSKTSGVTTSETLSIDVNIGGSGPVSEGFGSSTVTSQTFTSANGFSADPNTAFYYELPSYVIGYYCAGSTAFQYAASPWTCNQALQTAGVTEPTGSPYQVVSTYEYANAGDISPSITCPYNVPSGATQNVGDSYGGSQSVSFSVSPAVTLFGVGVTLSYSSTTEWDRSDSMTVTLGPTSGTRNFMFAPATGSCNSPVFGAELHVWDTTPCGCGGGGGGSPWIAVRDSAGHYIFINDVLRGGLFVQGQAWHDTTDYYVLPTAGVPDSGQYSFVVQERNTALNYLDQFSAYAVDHPSGTSVLSTFDGKIITYSNPAAASSITDPTSGTLVDVTGSMTNSLALAVSDSNPTAGITGTQGHVLYADFGTVSPSSAKLIVHGWNKPGMTTPSIGSCLICRTGIWVYVQDKGGWVSAGEVFLRKGGSIEGLDLSSFLKTNGQTHLKAKLLFLGGQRVDFVGLDKTPNASVTIVHLPLIVATFNSQVDVASKLASADGNYLVYGAREYFTVTFNNSPPPTNGLVRDIMMVTTGHYLA